MPAAVLGGSLLGTQGGEPGGPRLRVKVRGSPSGLGAVEHVEPGPALLIRVGWDLGGHLVAVGGPTPCLARGDDDGASVHVARGTRPARTGRWRSPGPTRGRFVPGLRGLAVSRASSCLFGPTLRPIINRGDDGGVRRTGRGRDREAADLIAVLAPPRVPGSRCPSPTV